MPQDSTVESGFSKLLEQFTHGVESHRAVFPLLSSYVEAIERIFKNELGALIRKKGEVVDEASDRKQYRIPAADVAQVTRQEKRVKTFSTAKDLVPPMLVVSLVSHFDLLVAELIRTVFKANPDRLRGSGKQFTYKDLETFGTIEEFASHLVNVEVESTLRQSHLDQIIELEKLLGITLRAELEVLPGFVEVTERRNLFAHCAGVVSAHYLRVCKKNNVKIDDVQVGTALAVTDEYFEHCCSVLEEMGTKLASVSWMKLYPQESEEVTRSLVDTSFNLVLRSRYALAIRIVEFALALPRKPTNEFRYKLVLNLAQAHKWMGDEEACQRTLQQEDWTGLEPLYRLGHAVLVGDFGSAADFMKQVGTAEGYKACYRDWPIFREFRKSNEFADAFKELFGETFAVLADEPLQLVTAGVRKVEDPPEDLEQVTAEEFIKRMLSLNGGAETTEDKESPSED